MNIVDNKIKQIIEAALMSVGKPMSIDQLLKLFVEDEQITASKVREAVQQLQIECEGRGIELFDVASGYRYQARQDYSEWISRLWEERPPKYSRASLETLALIAYRQPVTRGEIEDVRGVGVSSSIIKTLMEREWIRIVGHRDVPGRPALYATTKQFLDYFNMKSLEELPTLSEIKDLADLNLELELPNPDVHEEDETTLVSDKGLKSNKNPDSKEDPDSKFDQSSQQDLGQEENDDAPRELAANEVLESAKELDENENIQIDATEPQTELVDENQIDSDPI
ncbi:MAG: segregation and condensation protein B [Polaribacter sp.]|jgi:segregation and condensation protein B